MDGCITTGVTLSVDKENRLLNTINKISNGNNELVVLLSAIVSESEDFRKYVSDNIKEDDFIKDSNVDINNVTQKDYVDVKQNIFRKLLKEFYMTYKLDVNNTSNKIGFGVLMGFNSSKAKHIAQQHIINAIKVKINSLMLNGEEINKDKVKEIISDIINNVERTFYNRFIDFNNIILNTPEYANTGNKKLLEIRQLINDFNDANNKYKTASRAHNKCIDKIKELKRDKNTNNKEELEKAYNEYKDAKKILDEASKITAKSKHNVVIEEINFICDETNANKFINAGSFRLSQYANLLRQLLTNSDAFLFEAFNSKAGSDIINYFNDIESISEYIENKDEITDTDAIYDGDSIDEMAKSWVDSYYSSFNAAVNKQVKVILSTIPKLNAPFNPDTEKQAIDDNNELGVMTYMDYQTIAVQLYTKTRKDSVEIFVRDITDFANKDHNFYGLGDLANRMKNDPILANKIYAAFAKPIVKKAQVVVNTTNSGKGVTIEHSNPNAFEHTSLMFDTINVINGNYNKVYSKEDYEIIRKIYKEKIRVKGLVIESKLTDTDIDIIASIFTKYMPNFNKTDVVNIINKCTSEDKRNVITSLVTVIKVCGELKDYVENSYKEAKQKYDVEYNKYINNEIKRNDNRTTEVIPEPTKPKLDYSSVRLAGSDIIVISNMVRTIIKYYAVKVQLNSNNAAGKSAADVIKNNFITRLFDQINYSKGFDTSYNKPTEEGLKALGEYIMQGCDGGRENQYSHNPILFGVNGIGGMFERKGDKAIPKSWAKFILQYYLFDGTKNYNTMQGETYSSMTESDFFISQYIAYVHSLNSYDDADDTYTDNSYSRKTAVYPMRIGSDAPKIFLIRAPKLNKDDLYDAFAGHLTNELNLFVNGLNKVFENRDGKLRTKTSIRNLISRAFYDESDANKIDTNNGTDFTKAFVKDGRLRGNVFSIKKLFPLKGLNVQEILEQQLFLYGEDTKAKLNPTNNGGLIVNEKAFDKDGLIVLTEDEHGNKEFKLNLTDANKEILKSLARKWTIAYANENIDFINEKFEEIRTNIPDVGNYTTKGDIQYMLLNTLNLNMSFDDLFEGDYKLYKNPRDFFKRTKEVQAGGESYGAVNHDTMVGGLTELNWFDKPQVIQVRPNAVDKATTRVVPVSQNGKIVEKEMVARNGFRAVTIYNTIIASEKAGELEDSLYKEFLRQGIDEEKARAKAIKLATPYAETTTVNDAQSYITLDEFIRRKYADGTLDQYQDLLAQLLDPNIPAEAIDLDGINARIQVQKNFYYDKVYDKNSGMFVSRQIKNAEFVLIPKLLPENSELRKVHDWMVKNDIGQLNTAETDKAAKGNIFTIWNQNTGEFVDPNTNDNFNEEYVQEYYYQYLYKQQDVPQHMQNEKNKLGVQIAKVIGNNYHTAPQHVQRAIDEYKQALTANIEDSFVSFIDRMGWAIENGVVVNREYRTTDDEGNELNDEAKEFNKRKLNFTHFFTRARAEAARLGMDSNFMEYLIPNDDGSFNMPNAINNAMFKLQSIAQAIYNREITRQELPGWHGAQVTSVGYGRKLEFDAKNGVMEILVPRFSNLIPKGKTPTEDEAILKQLETEGITIQLGYRMPTEGKQSISQIKIVGFVPECLGSTILVPNEWVTQTGSDFDVDSIYNIMWELYAKKDKKGKIELHRIPFKEDEVNDRQLYIQYVNSKLEDRVPRDKYGNEIKDAVKNLKVQLREEYDLRNEALQELYEEHDAVRNKLFNSLPRWAQVIVINANNKATQKAIKEKRKKKKHITVDLNAVYSEILTEFENYLDVHKDAKDEAVDNYTEELEILIGVMNRQDENNVFNIDDYKNEKQDVINDTVSRLDNEYLKRVEEKAAEANLMSFEEFAAQPFVNKLSRKARNNYILDRMITIMNDPYNHEEQYGRSQFEDITNKGKTGASNIVDKWYGLDKRVDNPYDPITQLRYFDDAMSGARLKAISVNWDNFVSRCNQTHMRLGDGLGIEVIDEFSEEAQEIYKDDIHEINDENKRNTNINDNDDSLLGKTSAQAKVLNANKIGWSSNNHGVHGNLITPYVAETTAHHLDAIKEGSVPNVNEYTFGVYKLLVSLGLDYLTSISFIRQPIIMKVNQMNANNKSLFFNETGNPIDKTIKDIAIGLGLSVVHNRYSNPITQSTYIKDAIAALLSNYEFVKAFRNITGFHDTVLTSDNIMNLKIPINKAMLEQRIKFEATADKSKLSTSQKMEIAAFDFATLITFNRINGIANKINAIMLTINIDKNGTKNSIFATRKIKETIETLRGDNTIVDENGVNIINSLFPINELNSQSSLPVEGKDNQSSSDIPAVDKALKAIFKPIDIDVAASSYPPLAAAYKYATLTSLETNSQIFDTEHEDFVAAVTRAEFEIGKRFTEDEYKSFVSYAMIYGYNSLHKLISPILLSSDGRIIQSISNNTSGQKSPQNEFWDSEIQRIFGFGFVDDGDFACQDINNPTDSEIKDFMLLSPAQKVLFIKNKFIDGDNLFNYINVTLRNRAASKNMVFNRQYISFKDEYDNIEDLHLMFEAAFKNSNPLIKLAAIDIIKYAFIAEGYQFKRSYVNKLIPNKALYQTINDGGFDLINSGSGIRSMLRELPEIITSDEFIVKYVRSHSDKVPTISLYPNSKNDKVFKSFKRSDGIVILDNVTKNQDYKNLIKRLNVENTGYINVKESDDKGNASITLYEVYTKGGLAYFLVPLNKLNETEVYETSFYKYNNKQHDHVALLQTVSNICRKINIERTPTGEYIMPDVAKASRTVTSTNKKIGNIQVQHDYRLTDSVDTLTNIINSNLDKLKIGAKSFVKKIDEYIIDNKYVELNKDVYIYHPNEHLNNTLAAKTLVVQHISYKGKEYDVKIIRYVLDDKLKRLVAREINDTIYKAKQQLSNNIKDGTVGNYDDNDIINKAKELNPKLSQLLDVIKDEALDGNLDTISINSLYCVAQYIPKKPKEDFIERSAITDTLGINGNFVGKPKIIEEFSSIDDSTLEMARQINYEYRKNDDKKAKQFVENITRKGANLSFKETLVDIKDDVYVQASRYYRSASNKINTQLNGYELGGVVYRMDDEKLYQKLIEYPERLNDVINIILKAVTFGDRIGSIFKLDASTESKELADALSSIRESINRVKNNIIAKKAMANVIDIYFKQYATNPLVRENIINIRDQFGDTDTFIALVHDVADTANQEVQTILKHVYAKLSEAEMFTSKENLKAFKQKVDDIEKMNNEHADINKFIDNKRGVIRSEFNDKFKEDKRKIIDEFIVAKQERFESFEKYKVFVQKQFAKDVFLYRNTEQRIVADYYKTTNEITETALKNGGDRFIKYLMLSAQLRELNNLDAADVVDERNRILNELQSVRSLGYDEDNQYNRKQVDAINEYVKARKELREKYFESKEYEGFEDDYKGYDEFIKEYDKAHGDETLDKKLENPRYKEAYEWIKNNGRLDFDSDDKQQIYEAFDKLLGHNKPIANTVFNALKEREGVVDDNGIIDGTKLSDDDIKILRENEVDEYNKMYDAGIGDVILIKAVAGSNAIPIRKSVRKLTKEEVQKRAAVATINAEINDILIKAFDNKTGVIDFDRLLNDNIVTDTELKTLKNKLDKLTAINGDLMEVINDFSKNFVASTDNEYHNNIRQFIINGEKLGKINANRRDLLLKIVSVVNKENKLVPRFELFGVISPSDGNKDTKKMEARDFLDNNIEFITTEYYRQAERKAIEENRYDEWFKLNHIYNPYKHKFEPLKIWTTMVAKPGSEIASRVKYRANFKNTELTLKQKYENTDKYNEFGDNYSTERGDYTVDLKLNDKEKALRNLYIETLNKYAVTAAAKSFVGHGYLPRERKEVIDKNFIGRQAMAAVGVSFSSGKDTEDFRDYADYIHDKEADQPMTALLKAYGTKEYLALPKRVDYEDDLSYRQAVNKVREENRKIQEFNESIDNANMNTNWEKIMEDYIVNATIFGSRQEAKPLLYLLIEDIRNNKAYKLDSVSKKLVKDFDTTTKDDIKYQQVTQTNTEQMLINQTRRIVYGQFNKQGKLRRAANLLQNLSSAKFMTFNLYGGIANIATGGVNIAMEAFAGEFFSKEDLAKATNDYLSNSLSIVSHAFGGNTDNEICKIIEAFNIVDIDNILANAANNEELSEQIKQVRNYLYSFQSSGEHFMQNTVLLAMLRSNRIYYDNNKLVIGDAKDYTNMIERESMFKLLANKYPEFIADYKMFVESYTKASASDKYDIVSGRQDINRNFFKYIRNRMGEDYYRTFVNEFAKTRKDVDAKKRKDFVTDNMSLKDAIKIENGELKFTDNALAKFSQYFNGDINATRKHLQYITSEFKNKVLKVNSKIHGYYDRMGAGAIESKWYGSLIAQYHKHLPNGFLKRFRKRRFYNEFRGNQEDGAYTNFYKLLTMPFDDFKEYKNKYAENGEAEALASLQATARCLLEIITETTFNWNRLSLAEQRNIKRINGELAGVTASMLLVMALTMLSGGDDDDELKDNLTYHSLLYLADRLYAETTLYTPWGIPAEFKTQWSNPIAGVSTINDAIKGTQFIADWLFDSDFNPVYTTGRYKDQNKFGVLIGRNIPGYRQYLTISTVNKSNKYYKIGNTRTGINIAKSFGEWLSESF